jgi:crotonobetainyl-CoA:carnitine CoA-transferase CaiB-like acyl-CoA transferase
MTAPLAGLLVIDMAQFLSGPSAALRLADLGARVIKVERPGGGDICRQLYLSDTDVAGDSTLFHAINRNKEGFAVDLKDAGDAALLRRLLTHADVVIQNFRPGVADRLGFGAARLRADFPRLIVAEISGYGGDGPWAQLPGQDLLAQAMSGAMWLNGDHGDGPVPFGLSVADMLAGHILVEGILAALVRRGMTGAGAHVETSLLEAMVDLQFEVLTTHLNDGGRMPRRASTASAHAYLAAPYGVYATADGWLALAMTPLPVLGRLLGVPIAGHDAFAERDGVKALVADRLASHVTAHWLDLLRAEDVWCVAVQDWPALLAQEGFRRLDMIQQVHRNGTAIATTRTPIRIDGHRAGSDVSAPGIGQNNTDIVAEFGLLRSS